MHNSYAYYFRVNAFVPLSFLLAAVFLVFFTIVPVLFKLFRTSKNRAQNIAYLLLSLPVVFVFVFIVARPLLSGGYRLFFENENDRLTGQGYVQEIIECVNSEHRYNLETGVTEGYNISINQEKYHIMYLDNIQVGDNVYIEYLPNSKFILRIELISD